MIRINLLSKQKKDPTRVRGVSEFVLFVIIFVLGLLVLFFIHDAVNVRNQRAKDFIDKKNKDLQALKRIETQYKAFEKNVEGLNKQISIITQLQKLRKGPIDILDEISLLIPREVWLKNLNWSGLKISFSASGKDPQVIGTFITKLKKSTQFQAVDLKFVSGTPKVEYNFSVSLKVREKD